MFATPQQAVKVIREIKRDNIGLRRLSTLHLRAIGNSNG